MRRRVRRLVGDTGNLGLTLCIHFWHLAIEALASIKGDGDLTLVGDDEIVAGASGTQRERGKEY
jgi:hypothetical protein